jgi:diphosphomevalonate decarboxylase
VALVKYWGKRDELLNLPCAGSISLTLKGLESVASVTFSAGLASDTVVLNGRPATPEPAHRVSAFLDLIRRQAGLEAPAAVEVHSNFPVAAGLASSASMFAALAVAGAHAAGLSLSPAQLSVLARRGSGSAARSIFGGYVEWRRGEASDGADSHAVQIASPETWPLGVVIAIASDGPKPVGSRQGMRSALRSPFFSPWIAAQAADLDAVRSAIAARDLGQLGRIAERNCLAMHAVIMTATPPVLYWNPATLAVMHRVADLRAQGLEAYFTIDAGPQVKVICRMEQRAAVAAQLAAVAGVQRVVLSEPGAGAELLEGV